MIILNEQSKRIICTAFLCVFSLMLFTVMFSGFKAPEEQLPSDEITVGEFTEEEVSEPSSSEEFSEPSSAEEETVDPDDVTLGNKKPILEDEEYSQNEEQIKEDLENEKEKDTSPKDDILPSRPKPPKPSVPTEPESEETEPSESETLPTEGETDGEETTPPSEPPSETDPQPPVKKPQQYIGLPETLEYAGYGKYIGDKWVADNSAFYIDNKKVDSLKGIDISIAQREPGGFDVGIDFKAVKASGIDFVMVRLGARSEATDETWIDRYFAKNIKEATDAGLKVGVYFYSQAITEREAIEEAKICLEAIKELGCKIEYPIVIDVEGDNTRVSNLTVSQRTKYTKAFCETIIDGGYYPMIYANQEWLSFKLDMTQLPYDVWMACYKAENNVKTIFGTEIPFTMWQYGQREIPGIKTGPTDINVCLADYPAFLKKYGWNKL